MLVCDTQFTLNLRLLYNLNIDEFIHLFVFYFILMFTTAVHWDEIED